MNAFDRRRRFLVTGIAAALRSAGAVGATYAAQSSGAGKITGCSAARTEALRVLDVSSNGCRAGEQRLTWNKRGPRGAAGATEETAATGATGATGPGSGRSGRSHRARGTRWGSGAGRRPPRAGR